MAVDLFFIYCSSCKFLLQSLLHLTSILLPLSAIYRETAVQFLTIKNKIKIVTNEGKYMYPIQFCNKNSNFF